MCKKYIRQMSVYLIISVILIQMVFTGKVFGAEIKNSRLYGADRIQTAIEISKTGWPDKSDYVVLATAYDFPDALCAAPLAAKLNAPVLLTEKTVLNNSVGNELSRLNVKKVFIIGGLGVISQNVEEGLRSKGIGYIRLSGADRYRTSLSVARYMSDYFGINKEIAAVTGEDFPDALSISPIAARLGMPVILVPRNNIQDGLADFVSQNGINTTYIVGGNDIISDNAAVKLPGVQRINGSNKYERNARVIDKFAARIDFSTVYVATGENFPDALAGTALAAKNSSPIILSGGEIIESTRNVLKEFVKSNCNVTALGGPSVVADNTVNSLAAAISNNAVTVEAASVINLNQVKVTYTKKVDKASAETPANYKLGDMYLTSSDKIKLDPDGRTAFITLDNAVGQQERRLLSVKDGAVLSEDKSNSVRGYETELEFFDRVAPSIKSVTASGNKVLRIEFTEPLRISSGFINGMGTLLRLDGQYLISQGFNYAEAVDATSVNSYSSKIELRFGTELSSGSHTLVIPDSTLQYLEDEAGFRVSNTNISFTVDSVTNAPRIVSVTGEDNGIVYVTYDRPMDSSTALGTSMYNVNSITPMAADFKAGSDNKTVKLVFGTNVVTRGNNLFVADKDIKDTYGNFLSSSEDIRTVLTAGGDSTKPYVSEVSMIDSTHIRVKFSEVVDYQYAMNKGNYVLKDSYGQALNYISSIYRDTGSLYSDSFILNLSTTLTGARYNLEVKNIIDLAGKPNVMDDYTASISWNDSEAPRITDEVVPVGSSSQIIVYFSEVMDRASITNRTNLFYKDGNSNIRELPSSAVIEASADNKSVTITFSSAYRVKTGGWSGYTDVRGIVVTGAKDTAGNLLEGITAYRDVVSGSTAQNKPTYMENTFILYSDGDSIKAELEFTEAISTIYITDFRVAGVVPDAGYIRGNKVTLTFVNSDKIETIKHAGSSAQLWTAATSSTNAAGASINSISGKTVYDDRVAPEIVGVSAFGSVSGEDIVKIEFSENIDSSMADSYKDDFSFLGGGTSIEVKYATVSNEYVIYHFNSGSFNSSSRVIVRALKDNIHIRDIRDGQGDYNVYVPKTGDISGISASVQ